MSDAHKSRAELLQELTALRQKVATLRAEETAPKPSGQADERFLRTIIDTDPNAIFVKDGEGRFVTVNRSMAERYGLTPEAMEGMSEQELAEISGDTPEQVAAYLAQDRHVLDSLEPLSIPGYDVHRHDGLVRHLLATKVPLILHGKPDYVLGIAIDITERREAEAALETKTRQQEQLVKAAQNLTVSLELDDVLLRIAREAREIASSETVVIFRLEQDGRTLRPLVALDEQYEQELLASSIDIDHSLTGLAVKARRGMYFNSPIQEQQAYTVPNTPQNPQERVIIAPLLAEGSLLGILWLSRVGIPYNEEDLTFVETFAAFAATVLDSARHHDDLHRVEQTLRIERDRAQQYLDVAGVIIVALDQDHRVTLINRKGCEILGYPEEQMLGQDWIEEFVPPHHMAAVRDVFEQLMVGKMSLVESYQNPILTRDGREHQIDWHNSLLHDKQGRITGLLSSGTDITERVEAEEQLQWELGVTSTLSKLYKPLVGADATIEGIARAVLEQALGLSGSLHGFVSSIDHETQESFFHTMNARAWAECQAPGDHSHLTLPIGDDGRFTSLWGLPLNERRGFFSNQPAQHPASQGAPQGHIPLTRFLSAPVMLGEELVGQIGLANSPRDYTERDLEAVERLAEYYALAVQRIRNEQALESKTAQQQQLIETAQHLNESLDLTEVLERIGKGAKAILQAHGCAIYRLAPDGVTLAPLISLEPPHDEQILATPLHVDHSFTGQGIKARHGLIFSKDGDQSVGQQIPGTPRETEERVIVAPFVADGETLGAMCLNRLGEDFSRTDLALAETFAAYAASAFKNAQTHQTLQRAEHARRTSEQRYRTVVESINDVIFRLDAQGTITYISPVIEQIAGYRPEEVIGHAFAEYVQREDLAALQESWQRTLAGQAEPVIFRIRRRDGDIRTVRTSSRLTLGEEGQPVAVTGRLSDISEQLRLEERLRQAQKMETVGRLAGGVAHDFNNLLTVINGFSEILLSSMASDDPYRLDVEQIHHAGTRAADLVRRLLSFSRQQPVERKIVDINQVVGELAKMLQRIIGEDVQLDLDLMASDPLVMADQGQLEQVLINLAANARDAIGDLQAGGGTLSIETANVTLREGFNVSHLKCQPGPNVRLSIRDTGVGMAEGVRDHIFEPFFTTKDVDKGTGLGLAMVYGIAEEFGGCIDVVSAPGEGTTFCIYLPQVGTERPNDDVSKAQADVAERGHETILVIEHQEEVCQFVRQMLERLGYTVLSCSGAREALALCQAETQPKVDLLLVDVVMPQMSGPELVEQMRETRPDLKSLYMSGYADRAIGTRSWLGSGENIICKPFVLAEVARQIRRVLAARPKDTF